MFQAVQMWICHPKSGTWSCGRRLHLCIEFFPIQLVWMRRTWSKSHSVRTTHQAWNTPNKNPLPYSFHAKPFLCKLPKQYPAVHFYCLPFIGLLISCRFPESWLHKRSEPGKLWSLSILSRHDAICPWKRLTLFLSSLIAAHWTKTTKQVGVNYSKCLELDCFLRFCRRRINRTCEQSYLD